MYPVLERSIASFLRSVPKIPSERRARLEPLSDYLSTCWLAQSPARLIFICTHNSRRSQMAQIWAWAAAAHYRVPGVGCYSGGTEVTAVSPATLAALSRAGFEITSPEGENPRHLVRLASDTHGLTCFSKRYDDPDNPRQDYAAILTCSEADAACPVVPGASRRISLPYADPKVWDGTERQSAAYDQTCHQVATEMLYALASARDRASPAHPR